MVRHHSNSDSLQYTKIEQSPDVTSYLLRSHYRSWAQDTSTSGRLKPPKFCVVRFLRLGF